MKNENRLRLSWLLLMAWRDSRRNRSRLFLFISSVVLGIAALVATGSFGNNLRDDIDDQAKTLVGADLIIRSNRPLPAPVRALADSLPNRHSEERSFASMVFFIKSQGSRLVQVRALEGDYPFYGRLETIPAAAGPGFRSGRQALVDKTLLLQYGAQVGDSIRIGELNFEIAGALVQAPGRNEISTTVAPPVYIPLRYLAPAGLLQKGSRMEYQVYYQYTPAVDMGKLSAAIGPRLDLAGVRYETIESRKEGMTRSFGDLTQFLTLISFIALLMGCIGVASAVNIYIREKIGGIAVLRCLGLKARQAFLIYLIQVAGIGLIGSVAGAVLGVIVQQVLPAVLKDLLPLETSFRISWQAIGQGVGTGMIISMLFALLPLLTIRKISPLYTLRLSVEPAAVVWDPLKAVVYAAILLFIIVFSFFRMQSWGKATVFALSLLGAFLLLAGAPRLLMIVVRRLFPERWNYLWRQGFANLFRPNNQTLILVVTIGLGTTFIGTLYFVQQLLIERVTISASANQGNMVLFDIQHDQRDAIAGLARQHHLPVLQEIPIVTMRIKEIKGKTEEESPLARDSARAAPRRAFDMEMRVTYRDSLIASETLVAGKIWKAVRSPRDTIYISVDEDYARRFLHAGVGDPIVFDVQGVPIATVIGSLRKVEWRLRINFPVVFPTGVLEQAPQFDVLITQVPSPEASARFQQAVVRGYPNVSVIDLGLILSVLEDILGKIGFVIRFMAAFSMLTGVVVLIASVLISKYQRIQESVLLRTLGASRRQVLLITLLEYFFLGGLAAVTGIGLSLAFTGVMARWVFESPFAPHLWPVLLLFISVSGMTILIGLYNSRGVLNKPPLEILRREG